jgi:hypothetical protein
MKQVVLFFLFCFISCTSFAQNNPNDINVFSRVEALVSPYEWHEFDPAWFEINPPASISVHTSLESGYVSPAIWYWQFERFDDCRIKKISQITVDQPDLLYEFTFEYDDVVRKITVTEINSENGIGINDYVSRTCYQYDAEENLTEIIRYLFSENSNDWVLLFTLTYSNYDDCGNYENRTFEQGSFSETYHLALQYVSGTCLLASNSEEQGSNGQLYQNFTWNYNSYDRLTWSQYSYPGFCSQESYEYDQSGRLEYLKYGNCNEVPTTTRYKYTWNADNSLAELDKNPNQTSAFYKKIIQYGDCGIVNTTENAKLEDSSIRIKSPVTGGESVSVFGLPNEESFIWKMCDLNGREIAQGHFTGENAQIQLTVSMPAGLYFLNLKTENQSWSIHIIAF